MGDNSFFQYLKGCKIDFDKFKTDFPVRLETLKTCADLGEYLDDRKILTYWYDEFCVFLHDCANAMDLTEDKNDNFVYMQFIDGRPFKIIFFKENGKVKITCDYIPDVWETFEILPNGKLSD